MAAESQPKRDTRAPPPVLGGKPSRDSSASGSARSLACHGYGALRESWMKFALINPNWDFAGSTYFGCRDPHIPLELLFAGDNIRAAGHEAIVVDAQTDNLTIEEAKARVDAFAPDFLVVPTAPSYLFWRCPPPELRVPMEGITGLKSKPISIPIVPHPPPPPTPTLLTT